MKRIGSIMLAAAVLGAVSLLACEWRSHIPANAGGNVDTELDAGRIHPSRRITFMAVLSKQLKQHPKANRFRITSLWGDCGVSGKYAVVYDRSTHNLMTWAEVKNRERWFSVLSRSNYAGLQEAQVHTLAKVNMNTWMQMSRKSPGFDFLQKYGCTKTNQT